MELRRELTRRGFKPVRTRGQNFIFERSLLDALVRDAALPQSAQVLEIGSGPGTLTRALLDAGHSVVTCEIDRLLVGLLRDRFATELDEGRLTIVNGDVLESKRALAEPVVDAFATRPVPRFLVANLPYAISTPVLEPCLAPPIAIDGFTVLVQAEVAERWTSGPGSKRYAAISVLLGLLGHGTIGRRVPSEVFTPRPQVASAVVQWRRDPVLDWDEAAGAHRVARQAFGTRRKILRRSLEAFELTDTDFERLGIDPTLRAEQLPVDAFARIARHLSAR